MISRLLLTGVLAVAAGCGGSQDAAPAVPPEVSDAVDSDGEEAVASAAEAPAEQTAPVSTGDSDGGSSVAARTAEPSCDIDPVALSNALGRTVSLVDPGSDACAFQSEGNPQQLILFTPNVARTVAEALEISEQEAAQQANFEQKVAATETYGEGTVVEFGTTSCGADFIILVDPSDGTVTDTGIDTAGLSMIDFNFGGVYDNGWGSLDMARGAADLFVCG